MFLPGSSGVLGQRWSAGLFEEACWLLDTLSDDVRAGWRPVQGDVSVTKNALGADGLGCATLSREHEVSELVDYHNRLRAGEFSVQAYQALGLQASEMENKQRVLLATYAAVPLAAKGLPLSMDVVQQYAGAARDELWDLARVASGVLVPDPDVMTMQEANPRIFRHGALCAHHDLHDRDVRTFAAFLPYIFEDVDLRVWLVGPWGKLGELIFRGPMVNRHTRAIAQGACRGNGSVATRP